MRPGARRLGIMLALGASLIAGVGWFAPSGRAAVTFGAYQTTASANSVNLEIDVEKAPLLAPQLLFAAVSSAQSTLDSFGGSSAYAGAPFLGQTISGAGGLINGLAAGKFPPLPPTLPGYVASSYPSEPSTESTQGAYTVQAHSVEKSSDARAQIAGTSQPNTLAAVAVVSTLVDETGALLSKANAVVDPFAIGELLRIGSVQASASMGLDQAGQLTRHSALDLGTMTISGVKVGLTEQGFQLRDSASPIPTAVELADRLQEAGITLKIVPAVETPTSVTSAGLLVTYTTVIPVEGEVTVSMLLGQATAQLRAAGITPDANVSAGATEAARTAPDAASLPTTVGAAGVLPGTVPSLGAVAATPMGSGAGQALAAASRPVVGPDGAKFYLILVAAALALTLGSRIAGRFGS